MKNSELAGLIKSSKAGQATFTKQELLSRISDLLPAISEGTIAWRINQLKNENLIFQISRGIYSFEYKPEFDIEPSLKSKRIYNRVKPFVNSDLLVWDTSMLDSIIGSENQRHWIFISAHKDELEGLFNHMLDFSKKVFLQPEKEVVQRYLLPQLEAIVLTPLLTETPIFQVGDYCVPTIETILVNSWFKSDAYLTEIGYDLELLFQKSFEKYNVNESKLLRYASRRDKRSVIEKLINTIK